MPLETAAQAVEPRKEDPFIDIGLVELVANLPLQGSRYDDLASDPRMHDRQSSSTIQGSDMIEQKAY